MDSHTVTIVLDKLEIGAEKFVDFGDRVTLIDNGIRQGASASRNIGAGSIPKHRRHEHVLFLDDDVYMCPNWDARLEELASHRNLDFPDLDYPDDYKPNSIISGYSHPFNHCSDGRMVVSEYGWKLYGIPLVISSVAMMMPWSVFDDVGPWDEPGGPGGSEDYALCMRAKDKGYGFAVTVPHCVIHTGLFSSKGEQIVGYNELAEQNQKLLNRHGLNGKVIFG